MDLNKIYIKFNIAPYIFIGLNNRSDISSLDAINKLIIILKI